MIWARYGAVLMCLGILLGSFGAHGLKGKISEELLKTFQIGVFYHLLHALGLFAIAWLSMQFPGPKIQSAGILMLLGVFIFSGSLYTLALSGFKPLGMITPFGGLCFIFSWFLVAWHLFHYKP